MDKTSYQASSLAATLYFNRNTPLPKYANDSYPDGSINTSNEDLTRYLLEMIKGLTGNNPSLFSQEQYSLLFSPLLAPNVVPENLGDNQGVFWFLGEGSISHDGGDPGLSTFLQFFEDGQTGFLLMTNMDGSTDANEEKLFAILLQIFEAINLFIGTN